MEHSYEIGAALTVALALASGMVAQSLARHLRIPGIVLLLATVYLFWVLPYQVGDRPVEVEFEAPGVSP